MSVWFYWVTVLLITQGAAQLVQPSFNNGNYPIIVPLPTNNNQHRHASISHSHTGQTQHSHNNLPMTEQPNSPTHRHGAMIHSHSGPQIHAHANLPQSRDVQKIGNLHTHGTVRHSHGGPAIHYHPNLPISGQNHQFNTRNLGAGAQGLIDNQTTHNHGSVVRSHNGQRAHSHQNLPVSATDQLNAPRTHSHGSTVHSHAGPREHAHSNTHGAARDVNQNVQLPNSHVQAHIGRSFHAHPNLPPTNINQQQNLGRKDVLTGTPQQWHSQNALNNNANLPRDEAFRNLLRTKGFASPNRGRTRPIRPNYQLAGGASCQSQCMSGVASRSCYCARYMCYYQGCSSNCNLIQEGTNIRAECQQPRTVVSNKSNAPRCQQSIDPGTCRSRLYTRYAFDSRSGTCVRFIYSGCGGNKNRFTSRNACLTSCAQ